MNPDDLILSEIATDVKAEVIAADLVDEGYDIDDIVVTPAGLFEREFRRDILKIESRRDKLGNKELVFIDVCREGIYNSLPEALFHFFDREKRGAGAAGFTEEYKKHKAEEESADVFFQAFEKELFRARILNELGERKSMLSSSDEFKAELFLNLWPELREVSEKYLAGMLLLLPVSHKIVGDLELARTLISYVTDQEIKIRYSDNTKAVANNTGSNILGDTFLTNNLIIGNEVPDYTASIELSVGPVKKGELLSLLPGGEVGKVIEIACKYLFPVSLDVNISVEIDTFDEKLILSDDIADGKLGFTSCL